MKFGNFELFIKVNSTVSLHFGIKKTKRKYSFYRRMEL